VSESEVHVYRAARDTDTHLGRDDEGCLLGYRWTLRKRFVPSMLLVAMRR